MLFNLFLIRPLHNNSDKSPSSPKQAERKLKEQDQPSSLRHHLDAIESLQQLHQRYYLERRVF